MQNLSSIGQTYVGFVINVGFSPRATPMGPHGPPMGPMGPMVPQGSPGAPGPLALWPFFWPYPAYTAMAVPGSA